MQPSCGSLNQSHSLLPALLQKHREKIHCSEKRLEKKLEILHLQFDFLQKAADELTQRLEQQGESVVRQAGQDEMWISLLEDSFSPLELNVFYSYAVDTLSRLHSLVQGQLPEMVRELPTLAAIMKRKSRSQRIRQAFDVGLRTLDLCEEEIKTLCTFFITHCYKAQYLSLKKRDACAENIRDTITHVVKNQMLQRSLQGAVLVVEKGRSVNIVDVVGNL
ncbi:hypothetical protein FKM82_016444 [Ascaphus truei]